MLTFILFIILKIILGVITEFCRIYLFALSIRVFLAWIVTINWYTQPYIVLKKLTDPYLNLFRGTIPLILGMDFSSMLGFLFLECVIQLLESIYIEIIY
ncbi:hypothetical protein GpartN1_CHLp105 (chloroplast) [Galdieria partita]|uniref:YggT family protein n=1 Tax=Galdieria partita TaxID=83374 RepID=A0A9C7EY11_9RHOD|nr:hypothetical protein GpartN1_CHLp105 [Galdieria partita]